MQVESKNVENWLEWNEMILEVDQFLIPRNRMREMKWDECIGFLSGMKRKLETRHYLN